MLLSMTHKYPLYLLRFLLILLPFFGSSVVFAKNTTNVLIVHSGYAGSQWSDDIQRGIEQGLKHKTVEFYVEYLDSLRNDSPQYIEKFTELLKYKLQHQRFDAVIAVDNDALALLNKIASRYLGETPLLFVGINDFNAELVNNIQNYAGIEEKAPYEEGLKTALRLHPKVKTVYVVVDNSLSGELVLSQLQSVIKSLPVQVKILQRYTIESLKAKVASLEKNGLIYYLFYRLDADGKFFESKKVIKQLTEVSLLPIYTGWDFNMVPGVIGGHMVSGFEQGLAVSGLASKLLSGFPIKRLGTSSQARTLIEFDYKQLKARDISTQNLPKDSIVINTPSSKVEVNSYLLQLSLFAVLILLIAIYYHVSRLMRSQRALRISQSRFDTLFNQATQYSGLLHTNGTIEVVNQAVLNALKIDNNKLSEMVFVDLPLWESSNCNKELLQDYLDQANSGERIQFNVEIQSIRDGLYFIEFSLKPLFNQQGRVEMILVEGQDVTKIKLAEISVRESESQMRLIYEENPSLLITLELDGTISTLNRAVFRLLGYRAADLLGRPISLIYADSEFKNRLPIYLNQALRTRTHINCRELSYLSESGKPLWFKETVRKLPGKKQFLLVAEDITENRELSKRLKYQANHDFLTGLYNRNYFEQILDQLIDDTMTNETHHALFYLDLDQFKVINDTFGHNAGDEAITQISELFRQLVPDHSHLARLGGDEFGLLYPNCSRKQAQALGQKMLEVIKDFHFQWQDNILSIGCSIGLVLIDQHSGLRVQIMSAADSACYAAKDEGRNQLHLFEPDDLELQKRKVEMEWVSRVEAAMREQRFCLYAQPICAISPESEGKYLHYEVLARMIDEQGELVSPGNILPAVENYNLANGLDKLLVEKTLLWLEGHPGHVSELAMCSINLSGQSVGNTDFVTYLLELLADTQLPMQKLCFEITETTAIANFSQASRLIESLHNLGCKIALDDFGSGLSSFGYLKKLDVDFIKIDGIFIRDMINDKRDYAIVSSINGLGKILGKKIIAEYVENEACLAQLKEIGVDFVQGYYLGRPQPIELITLSNSADSYLAAQIPSLVVNS